MKKFIISKEELLQLTATYKTKKAIAEYLGISVDTVKRCLAEHHIEFNTRSWKLGQAQEALRKHPEVNAEWLTQHWLNTDKSLQELSTIYNISLSILESRASFYKLKKQLKHSFNRTKFYDATDPHIWYFAGLLVTDGYFPKDYDACTISLYGESEQQLLEEMKSYYSSTQPVVTYVKNNKAACYWQVSDFGLQEFFTRVFNLVTRDKTFKAEVPIKFPNEDCAKAYVRGCLDGDGYVAKGKPVVDFCTASEPLVKGLAEIVKTYTGIDYRFAMVKRREDHFYPLVEWKTQRARQLLDWVYSLDDCFKLERKYQRYLNYYQTNSKKDV